MIFSLQPFWDWLLLTFGREFFECPLHFTVVIFAVVTITGIGYSILDWTYKRLSLRDIILEGTMVVGGYAIILGLILTLHYRFRPISVDVPSQAPSLEALLLQVAVFMIVGEVFAYWWHRLEHNSKFIFRHVHYLHHKGRQPLTVWTNYVLHPVEGLAFFICFNTALFVYGAHPLTFMVYSVASITPMVVTHSGYDPIWYPTWIFACPTAHDFHHAKHGVNFSVMMGLGDKLFGTYEAPSASQRAQRRS